VSGKRQVATTSIAGAPPGVHVAGRRINIFFNTSSTSKVRAMFQGKLLEIYVGAVKGGPMQSVASVGAAAGKGLAGDRYGQLAPATKPMQEVTLIESEAIAAAVAEEGLAIAANICRRNLVTRDVPLNHLVGRSFRVGSVVLRGIELCEPCGHLEKMTVSGIRGALLHRGGLRAQVVEGGTINAGDDIAPVE
jgi:MOSC domain-containing protein YiiM